MGGKWLIVAGFIATVIIVTLLGIDGPKRDFVFWAGNTLMVGMAVAFFIRACRLARPMQKSLVRRLFRAVRFLRKVLAVSPAVKFLHVLAWSIGCMAPAAVLTGHKLLEQICITTFFIVLFIAGVADLIQRGGLLAKLAWSELLGKLFSVSIGAILLCLAIARAKMWVHSIAHIDPKYLTESTAIFAAVLLPIMYCLFGMALLYLLAILQMLGLAVYAFSSMITEQIGPFAGAANYARFRLFWYRIAKGKKPLGGTLPSGRSSMLDSILIFSKPLSTIAIITAMTFVFQTLGSVMLRVQPYLTTALVALEYRQGGSCIGLGDDARVAYMEDGNVSVVRMKGQTPTFSVEACKFRPDGADS